MNSSTEKHTLETDNKDDSKRNEKKQKTGEKKNSSETKSQIIPKNNIPDPIVPELIQKTPLNVKWIGRHGCVLIRKDKRVKFDLNQSTKPKVAAFDLDGTILCHRTQWPSRPEHYELWSSKAFSKIKSEAEKGYHLLIVTNQGGIKGACKEFGKKTDGKNVQKVKGLIEWIAKNLEPYPLIVVLSTNSKLGYHKPDPRMFFEVQKLFGIEFDLSTSFYVGDSDGDPNAEDEYQQRGIDKIFAENVGFGKFRNPIEYFGDSDMYRRKNSSQSTWALYEKPSEEVLEERRRLVGGYLNNGKTQIMIILIGVQGSGKSTFASKLCSVSGKWKSFAQDSISKSGKPGSREAVESAVIAALNEGKNVMVDRMHLNAEQRSHFIKIAKEMKVKVHGLVFKPDTKEILKRVRQRTNHPGRVEGESGAVMASKSIDLLQIPKYQEGFHLISIASSEWFVQRILLQYSDFQEQINQCHIPPPSPLLALGTMIGKTKEKKFQTTAMVESALSNGFKAIDTAPTYENEDLIGNSIQQLIQNPDKNVPYLIIKIPKRAVDNDKVRTEVIESLKKLQTKEVDVALLHWPIDFIQNNTLESVWKELEKMQLEGKIKHLGVSNFNVDALRYLLSICKVKPILNQVERHPFLPCWELYDFCLSQNIMLQAHTSLGHANETLFDNDVIKNIANKRDLSVAQVLLAWNIQQSVGVVVKCNKDEHQKEAVHVLHKRVLLSSDMKELDSLGIEKTKQIRFVAPPFMYRVGASYSWGNVAPKR